uniref:UDP-glycosyltransferase n=2 Tax=Pectinophora gossypiella TaxID=13191 RepID=A0A1E1WB02_PECGO
MLIKKLVVFGIFLIIPLNEAYRILVVFPLGSRSHAILGQGFVKHLLDAGHEVVHITSFPNDKPVPNLKEISVASITEKYKEKTEEYDMFKLKNMVGKSNIGDSLFFLFFPYDFHKQFLNVPAVQELLTDPKEKFDAVVIEWFFHDAVAGIASLFQSPLIWVGSTEAHWQVLNAIDEIPNPSYSVNIFSTTVPPLDFWGRIVELWSLVKKFVIIKCVVVPFENFLYNGVFPELAAKRGITMPSYDESVYNASLLLLNSHPSFGIPYKLPQNAKYIGGYHIDPKVKPLPENLQQIMDRAEHGVIYFSMGSNLRSADMSDYMRNSLLRMFGKLKETVIWKFEDDSANVPTNVHLVKWAPQQSILGKHKYFTSLYCVPPDKFKSHILLFIQKQ